MTIPWKRLAIATITVAAIASGILPAQAQTVSAMTHSSAASAAEDEGSRASATCEVKTWFTFAAAFADVYQKSVQVQPVSKPDEIIVTVKGVIRGSGKEVSTRLSFDTRKITSQEVPWLERTRAGSVEVHLTVRNNRKRCTAVGYERK